MANNHTLLVSYACCLPFLSIILTHILGQIIHKLCDVMNFEIFVLEINKLKLNLTNV